MLTVYGLFLVSGVAVGSLYALGGIGLVILRRSTGVLNFANGVIAALSAMVAWQIIGWGAWQPVGWLVALATGFLAGMAGALLSGALGQMDARSFLVSEGILLVALAVVGGVHSWLGAVLAGVLYKLLPAFFNDLGISADSALIIFGAALLTAPSGLAGQLQGLFPKKATS